MTNHKYLFAKMTELSETISFGEASKVEVKGTRNVTFLQKNEKLGMVKEIYYISEIKNKILSVCRLMKIRFEIFMKKITLHLKDSRGRVIARVEIGENRMFKLNLQRIKKYHKINKKDEV
jgi:hypothetical protein